MRYYKTLFICLAFLICISCFTQPEKEQQQQFDPLTYLKDSVIFDRTTYDFDTHNVSRVHCIETTFQGKNIGQDSILIQCSGDIMTTPSSRWVPPKPPFSIKATYFVAGKRGPIQQKFVANIAKEYLYAAVPYDSLPIRRVYITMQGYAINEESND